MALTVTLGLSSLTSRMQGPAWYRTAALPSEQRPLRISRCLSTLLRLVPLAAGCSPQQALAVAIRMKSGLVPSLQKENTTPAPLGLLRKVPTHGG